MSTRSTASRRLADKKKMKKVLYVKNAAKKKKKQKHVAPKVEGLVHEQKKPALFQNTILTKVQKRDRTVAPFDGNRIVTVIYKAMLASSEGGKKNAEKVAKTVISKLERHAARDKSFTPFVELIQDMVEEELMYAGFTKSAKAFIIYRDTRAKLRDKRGEVPQKIRELSLQSKKYFRNQLSEFVYYTTYSKWVPDEGRRETWIETVGRYVDFMRENLGTKLSEKEYAEIQDYMLHMRAMGSMRLLWSSGKAARATNVAGYNCAFIAPTKWQDFAEIAYVLMCGTGLGFSVERQNTELLPVMLRQTGKKLPTFVIPDSKEGWSDAIAKGLSAWAEGSDIAFDYSKIRPQGARLATMGGRASGPEPLRALLDFSREKMLARQGRRLSPLDVHDIICKIGEVVVMGGVRRSALISLSDLDEKEMKEAKNGQFYLNHPERSMANNSVAYNEKPTAEQFLNEWLNLVYGRSGERGIFNRGGLQKQLPARRWPTFKEHAGRSGLNPCVPKDTWIMTDRGARRVADLIGIPFTALVNGVFHQSNGFFKTGTKELFEVSTRRGFVFKATANHRVRVVTRRTQKILTTEWKEVGNLTEDDEVVLHNHAGAHWSGRGTRQEGWLLGNLYGDGNIEKSGKANLDYWGVNKLYMMNYALALVHDTVEARRDLVGHVAKTGYARVGSTGLGALAASWQMTHGKKIPQEEIEKASSDFFEGFLRGWFDADGSVQGNREKGVSIRLASSNEEALRAAQRMLARLGVIGELYTNRRNAGMRLLPNGMGGYSNYFCQANHELIIHGGNLASFASRIGFSDPAKKEKLTTMLSAYKRKLNRERFFARINEIHSVGTDEVYDCHVADAHAFDGNGVYLHNCGEINLRSKQFCNLSEVVVRAEDTEEDLMNKVRVATMLGTYQASLTNFPYLSKEWKENCEEERLLGVSMTGQWDNPALESPSLLRKMKEVAMETNKKYARKFGINESTAITCVKPSGNGSQLFDCASGCHPRYAKYYIRRVRIESHNPLFHMLRDMGVPHQPEIGQNAGSASTYVIEFPVKAPEGAVTRHDLDAAKHLEFWKKLKENYTEHNPSVTVQVEDHEWMKVGHWVYDNWDLVGGISFLPKNDHVYRLAPYEEISKERYETLSKNFPEIDFSKVVLYEYEDATTGAKELACAAGTCEIDIPIQITKDAKEG